MKILLTKEVQLNFFYNISSSSSILHKKYIYIKNKGLIEKRKKQKLNLNKFKKKVEKGVNKHKTKLKCKYYFFNIFYCVLALKFKLRHLQLFLFF